MTTNNAFYNAALSRLHQAQHVLIVSHANPDGDALGSTLALGLGLESMGKNVVMYNADPVPYSLRFLPQVERLVRKLPAAGDIDLAIIVDCAQPERVSKEFEKFAPSVPLFYIDHHILENIPTAHSCIDPTAAATGHVIYEILTRLKVQITADLATLIYTTLVMDTGFFRYSNTTSSVFQLAATLVEFGAQPAAISQAILENCPRGQMKLLQLVLATLEFHFDGQCASLVLTQQMLEEAQATADMAENFINYPRSVEGVEVAVLFREQESKRYKVSLRSKARVNVSALTKGFGGGGHFHAAGCTLEKTLAEAKADIFPAIEAVL